MAQNRPAETARSTDSGDRAAEQGEFDPLMAAYQAGHQREVNGLFAQLSALNTVRATDAEEIPIDPVRMTQEIELARSEILRHCSLPMGQVVTLPKDAFYLLTGEHADPSDVVSEIEARYGDTVDQSDADPETIHRWKSARLVIQRATATL